MSSPYDDINLLPPEEHGWFYNDEQFRQVFEQRAIKTVIEIGSWLGQSTIAIAKRLPPDGKIYAVDHWLGSPEHQPNQWAFHPKLPRLYQQFLSNVVHAGVKEKVVPVRMSSLEAAAALNVVPDLIYIDAAHETEAVLTDVRAWYPRVKGLCVFCGDDYSLPSVQKALVTFMAENKVKVMASGNFWYVAGPADAVAPPVGEVPASQTAPG